MNWVWRLNVTAYADWSFCLERLWRCRFSGGNPTKDAADDSAHLGSFIFT